ncbi:MULTISPECIES: pyocin activator PrtN family protein [unclassified Yoonia]|uniref:pyocin activator PrtN family protein n=1 Tax=unclassified Yoonia TaxID=2629118 RepID=UPI002AFFCDA3|nr:MULTISPECIES: pyocin activator PrtN family protein [unclassified Yoonia]
MNTIFLLMAQYNGRAIIPLDEVCRDFFSHLQPEKFLVKIARGEIKIPVVRIEHSQKSAKGVHISDLAEWIDARRAAAKREMEAMSS